MRRIEVTEDKRYPILTFMYIIFTIWQWFGWQKSHRKLPSTNIRPCETHNIILYLFQYCEYRRTSMSKLENHYWGLRTPIDVMLGHVGKFEMLWLLVLTRLLLPPLRCGVFSRAGQTNQIVRKSLWLLCITFKQNFLRIKCTPSEESKHSRAMQLLMRAEGVFLIMVVIYLSYLFGFRMCNTLLFNPCPLWNAI